ncbi:hypothetical protein GA0115236_14528 [Streptomyces sp. IgraMP-1]|nr:hypothetical protein GA0115236_14528 [Streptomyces sp. IgraMP-1]
MAPPARVSAAGGRDQDVLAAASGDVVADVADGGVDDLGDGVLGVVRLVRGDDDVGEGHQAGQHVVGHHVEGLVVEEEPGLGLVDVEADAEEAAGAQDVDQGAGVDEAAPAGVDEDRVVLHQVEGVGVHEVFGGGQQRDVQADHVGLAEQLLALDVAHAEFAAGGVLRDVPAQQVHPEAVGDPGERLADAAGADHADGAAAQVAAHQPLQPEVEVAGAVGGPDDAPVDGHREGPGELGDGVRRVGGDPGDGQGEAFGDVEVDVVEAGGALRDELGAARRQGLEHGAAEVGVDAGGDGLVAAGDGGGVPVEEDVDAAHLVLAREGPFDQRPLVVLHAECQDLHAVSPGRWAGGPPQREDTAGQRSAPGVPSASSSSSSPASMAYRTSSTRLWSWSLPRVFCTWFWTVRCEMTRRSAICL